MQAQVQHVFEIRELDELTEEWILEKFTSWTDTKRGNAALLSSHVPAEAQEAH
jgi:hypothetical protein